MRCLQRLSGGRGARTAGRKVRAGAGLVSTQHVLYDIIIGGLGDRVQDEFGEWWDSLDPDEQESVTGYIDMLEEKGPELKRPYADAIHGSRFINMREL